MTSLANACIAVASLNCVLAATAGLPLANSAALSSAEPKDASSSLQARVLSLREAWAERGVSRLSPQPAVETANWGDWRN